MKRNGPVEVSHSLENVAMVQNATMSKTLKKGRTGMQKGRIQKGRMLFRKTRHFTRYASK